MNTPHEQIHATAVAIDGRGVLILGPSGAGKSDLALRLIDEGAILIADDRVDLTPDNGGVLLSGPATIAGLLEVRGVGIVRMRYETKVSLSLVVDLVEPEDMERLPDRLTGDFMGASVRRIALDPFQVSAPAKIRLALRAADRDMLQS
ncbi:MAG: serine/threonine protein kinase [Rhodospirillales bacterium]|nr:serine/threonine protein kinase [Rhodospirillales bacterium]